MYKENMTKKLEDSGHTGQWSSIYKFLSSDDMPARWNVTELQPNQISKQLANNLADHFAKITNMNKQLEEKDIPKLNTGPGLIPQLDMKSVEDFIKKFKKCASRVNGDIPRELVNPCAPYLAKALTPIYNACMLTKSWPDFYKIGTVVLSPKTISPGGMDDIRTSHKYDKVVEQNPGVPHISFYTARN